MSMDLGAGAREMGIGLMSLTVRLLKGFVDNKPIIPIPFLKSNLNNLSLSLMMILLYGQLLRIKF